MELRNPMEDTDWHERDSQGHGSFPARPRLHDRPGTAAPRTHCGAGPQGQGRVRAWAANSSKRKPPCTKTLRLVSTPEEAYRYMRPQVRERVPRTLRRADDGQPQQADPSSPGVHRQPDLLHCSSSRGFPGRSSGRAPPRSSSYTATRQAIHRLRARTWTSTHRLRQVGEVMGVRVHDHDVCGHDRFFSFHREGLL